MQINKMWGIASCMAGMALLSLLKLARGVTLTATGNLVAPPLHVTKNILLPALYEMGKDYVTSVTHICMQDKQVSHRHQEHPPVFCRHGVGRYTRGKPLSNPPFHGYHGRDLVEVVS
jgi:hypothetical protein